MDLQIMRTVLKNDVNEVLVCSDALRDSGVYYTVVSISDEKVRRDVVRLVKADGLFANNKDFIGSFSYENSFCLVFTYRNEVRLCDREAFIATDFKQRKELASAFIMACIEADCKGSVGELLITDANINVGADNRIQFNYFLDFNNYKADNNDQNYYSKIAEYVYEVLAREYISKYEDNFDQYPDELTAFNKKHRRTGFANYNQILTYINIMPDKPTGHEKGIKKIFSKIKDFFAYIRRNSMTIFTVGLVIFTVIYLFYQITARYSLFGGSDENTNYSGLYTIGEVYLGDEDL